MQTIHAVQPAQHAFAAVPYEAAFARRPLLMPPRSRTLSGRPSCRIYLGRHAWLLEFETACGGWMEHWAADNGNRFKPNTLAFPTLAEAVGYAERHGYDYRIEPPAPRSGPPTRRRRDEQRLPRAWRARLASNANGDIYHG